MKIFRFIGRLIFIGLLVGVLFAINFFKSNQALAEMITSQYTRIFGQYATMISGYVPMFSITEIFVVVVVLVLVGQVIAFIVNLFKGHPIKGLNHVLSGGIFVLLIAIVYSASCEFAYNRDDIPLPFYETKVEKTEFVNIYNEYVDDLNACVAELSFDANGEIAGEVNLQELATEVSNAHTLASDDYYYGFNGSVKPLYSSFGLVEFQITGISFAPFGEANINTMTPKVSLPLTIAHELAHTRGVMREDDANQLAFYVCLSSSSAYLRYSAYVSYFYQLEAMVSTTYLTEGERAGMNTVDPMLALSRSYVNSFWQQHKLLENIGDFINNLYIKSSGVEEGTDSYNIGTEIGTDPVTSELIPSLYQKLFFEKYYRV